MQLLATAELMQQFDSSAITTYSLPGIVLMENAGRAFVDVLEKHITSLSGKSVLIICGKGNNGGDGFVIARHLANRGAIVRIILLCGKNDVKGDAKANLDIVLKEISSKKSRIIFSEVLSGRKFSTIFNRRPDVATTGVEPLVPISKHFNDYDVIVDAIFGTGFAGEVNGIYKIVIEWINAQRAFIASVDIASGVNATTGIVASVAVKANLTVTMGLGKIGQYVGSGRDHSGRIEIVDISIPHFLFTPSKSPTLRVQHSDVKCLFPKRSLSAHKNSVGRVFVLAGSRSLTGAPFMAAQSALKSGAGAVVLGVPKSIHDALIRKVAEVMVTPLDETSEGSISRAALPAILEKVNWADVVAIGPGLSTNEETQDVVQQLLKTIDKPVVLDADGINAMGSHIPTLKMRKAATIMTPHVGELRKLIELDAEEIERSRVEVARMAAKQLNAVVCLKGAPTATGIPAGTVFLNSTGNPGMATAGSGDVLTGIVSSLLAQGMHTAEAAYAGVFVHGLAGDIAAEKFGQRSLMALDILDCIHDALKRIEVE